MPERFFAAFAVLGQKIITLFSLFVVVVVVVLEGFLFVVFVWLDFVWLVFSPY